MNIFDFLAGVVTITTEGLTGSSAFGVQNIARRLANHLCYEIFFF